MAIDRKLLLAALLSSAVLIGAGTTPKPLAATPKSQTTPHVATVTDASVAERVLSAHTKEEQLALADYFKAKAAAEDPRIDHFEQLFRAYLKMEGKLAEPLQRQSRLLLKAARMSKQRYLLLSQAHRTIAWEAYER
jgi:hypothetical protein